ncbi:hypothetical protein L249_1503 [Ophiocordyceps polyrhachis-furcata BCC 54312]|uniref:Uncharacterized protein n=1 Tax=Ophiocordyceps polyrhachis-furcata BCC 54312 TaxID=1330021 RepID=A0A367L412_9HYPO|nr:hypothetical protein L249_1503 [Ophiocordyceps polyrhachis-furcata BCC 54312]
MEAGAGNQVPPEPQVSQHQKELGKILKGIKHDVTLLGVLSLGKDGVLRSLTADRQVVDAVALSPPLIKAMLDRTPFNPQNEIDYRGVDGREVPREQWFHPDKHLLPPPLVVSDERRAEAEAKVEENKKWLQERAEEDHDPSMKSALSLRFLCQVSAFLLPLASASPAGTASTLRYVSGSVSDVANGMKFTDDSVFTLGSDGVLRTFSKGRDVLDYRQLDPEQARDLAAKQVDAWERSGKPVPDSVMTLAHASVDGRLVTDIDQLLKPKEKPAVADDEVSVSQMSRRRSPGKLFRRAGPRICPGSPGCSSLADCQRHHCNACFFPHGPPHGTCFL